MNGINWNIMKKKVAAVLLWLFFVCQAVGYWEINAMAEAAEVWGNAVTGWEDKLANAVPGWEDKQTNVASEWEDKLANAVLEWQENIPQPLEELSLYATSAVLMDADSGRILYAKNGFTQMAMASTTKIMTCIVALENADMAETAEVSGYASGMPKVKLYIRKGESYSLGDLLYSLMLESHNDSAVVIAEHIGKKYLAEELQKKSAAEFTNEESKQAVAAFADLMNRKAREIGCRNTWFITPNGLDATETIHMPDGSDLVKEHSTTAADLAGIMSYCILDSPAKETFLQITRTSSHSFAANGRSFQCTNHNAFLNMMDGALSGKTGFTNKAGYCYVGALKRDNRTYVVTLLACGWPNNKTYKWSDTRELMEYGIKYYTYHQLSEVAIDTGKLQPIPVADGCTVRLGDTAYVSLEAAEAARGGMLLREDEGFTIRYTIEQSLEAPVAAGTEVGCVEYLLGDVVCGRIPVRTLEHVEKIDFTWCIRQILNRFLIS